MLVSVEEPDTLKSRDHPGSRSCSIFVSRRATESVRQALSNKVSVRVVKLINWNRLARRTTGTMRVNKKPENYPFHQNFSINALIFYKPNLIVFLKILVYLQAQQEDGGPCSTLHEPLLLFHPSPSLSLRTQGTINPSFALQRSGGQSA